MTVTFIDDRMETDSVNKRLSTFLFSAQIVGAAFYGILFAAYSIPFPSSQVLIGEPAFKLLLTVSGGAFLALTLASLLVIKKKR